EEQVSSTEKTVHLAGFLGTSSGGAVASYWKDGAYGGLTHDSIYSQVNSLYVDGSTVLIGGWKIVASSPPPALIWQDGIETVIDRAFGSPVLIASRNNNLFGVWHEGLTGWVINKNSTEQPIIDTAYNIGPTGLTLLGDDMYISGCSVWHDGKPDSKTYQNAQCWKNDQLIFRESENSNAMSIFIHQNDIYMAGYLHDLTSSTITACYWKNGQRVDLNVSATATSVFVTDAHVYVSGLIIDQGVDKAVYWKDGVATELTKEGTFSMANSVFVQGTDVHVAGYEHGYPAYWKNDVKQNISNQDRRGQIKFVVVGSN
ncbi:MAG TPA: hypothetical protein VK666_14730, partial [Chryseolinea sp.]|nr:hypothetical protein [Chryseolinea sp.]